MDNCDSHQTVQSPRLRPGDRVRIVSPASPPSREGVARGVELLTSWGLRVELGEHVFDQWGYMAGRDEDRVFDLNTAFADPGVRAVIATRGGKGAYRVRADNPVTLCDLRVLVDEAAKAVAPDDARWAIGGGWFGCVDAVGASLSQ